MLKKPVEQLNKLSGCIRKLPLLQAGRRWLAGHSKLLLSVAALFLPLTAWQAASAFSPLKAVYLVSGASLLAADFLFILHAVEFPRRFKCTTGDASSNSRPGQAVSRQVPMDRREEERSCEVDIGAYYKQLPDRTTLLSLKAGQPGHTAQLRADSAAPPNPPAELVTVLQGTKKRLPIIGSMYTIGRSSADTSFAVTEAEVSRRHAQIGKSEQEGYWLRDLGSTNGTFLNGERLIPDRLYPLNNGDAIHIGKLQFNFVV